MSSTPPSTPRRSRLRSYHPSSPFNSPRSLKSKPSITTLSNSVSNQPSINFKPYLATLFLFLAFFGPLSQAFSIQRYFAADNVGRDLFELKGLLNSTQDLHTKSKGKDSSSSGSGSKGHRLAASASLNETFVRIAKSAALDSPRASWEQGTLAQGLLELEAASWTGFANDQYSEDAPFDILRFGARAVANQDSVGRLSARVSGDESTTQGASLDSASSGPVVLLAAKANDSLAVVGGPSTPGGSFGMLMRGAKRQYNYVTQTAPRASNGFISQRAVGLQAWADSAYMGPPFLAAYGELTKSQSILQEGYNQMKLLRGYMRKSSKLWGHIWSIDNNNWQAEGSWNTGQGWALYGMIRVLLSIHQSPFSNNMIPQKNDLVNWANELLDALIPFFDDNSDLFHNYVDQKNTFSDGSGSMLIAASIYRLSSILSTSQTKASTYIPIAEKIYSRTSNSLDQFGLFTNGVQVVSVLGFDDPGFASVEVLSFGLMMQASKRDYMATNCTKVYLN